MDLSGSALSVAQARMRPAAFDLPHALDYKPAVEAMGPAMQRHAHPQRHRLAAWQQQAVLTEIVEPVLVLPRPGEHPGESSGRQKLAR